MTWMYEVRWFVLEILEMEHSALVCIGSQGKMAQDCRLKNCSGNWGVQ